MNSQWAKQQISNNQTVKFKYNKGIQTNKKSLFSCMQNRNRRLNRSLSPFPVDHSLSNLSVSPDYNSKLNYKQNSNTNAESHVIPSNTKEFLQSSPISTDYQRPNKKRKPVQEEFFNMSISEINLELDNNMNEIIYLLGKRKHLMTAKKRKMRDDVEARLVEARNSHQHDLSEFPYARDKDFLRVTEFCKNLNTAVTVFTKLLQVLPNLHDPNLQQKEKSQQFWQKNRHLENDIDDLLAKLKATDKNLEKQNNQVHEICKELDKIEEHLKSFAGSRTSENVERVEPLFQAKKKKYDVLNRKIKTLDYCKDTKIDFIKKIKKVLDQLLAIRQKRLKEIAQFFGLDSFQQFAQIDFKDQGDFTNSFEELLKLKEKDSYLEVAERQAISQIDSLEKQQQKLYNQLLKKQSDQAKAYHSYNDIIADRVKCAAILSLFGAQTQSSPIFYIEPKQLTKKFKEYKGVIKIFLEQENSLREGLVKTSETSKTFSNLLSSTENQKQRRYELLTILETCIRRRGQYEQKKQQLRHLAYEQNRNQQELTQYEEELETILTDGDIQNYKQIGKAIGQCEKEKTRLNLLKQKIEKQMEHMDRQVIALANKVKHQYEDILCDIVPSDCQYSLKNGEDVKKLRNHLRKMYKRLGILSHESN